MAGKNNWGNYTQSEMVELEGGRVVFVSYYTPVLIINTNNMVAYGTKEKFSRTTSKQITQFLNQLGLHRDKVVKLDTESFIEELKYIGFNGSLGWLK